MAAAEPEPMPVTGVALVATAVLHTITCLLLARSLPQYVPVAFGASLEPALAGPRVLAAVLALGYGLAVAGTAAIAADRVTHRATRRLTSRTADRVAPPVRADRLRHLGAVTVLFLTFEVAAVYGPLGGVEAASWASADAVSYPSASIAVDGFREAGGRLPTAALVIVGVYLAYLVTWAFTVRARR